ncbi:MAG TPA: NEW3 domain-containing protein [Longilinea sp.]|nr:NEW3 domain-containing protein [Longilinea sp.]
MKKSLTYRILTGILLLFSLAALAQPAWADDATETPTETVTDTVPPADTDTPAPPVEPPFSVAVDSSSKSGIPGSVVSYTITLTNLSDSDALNASVTVSSISGWTPAPSAEQSHVTVSPGDSVAVMIDVPVPTAADAGQNDKEVVRISSGSREQTVNLTTTVKAPAVPGRPLLAVSSYSIDSGEVAAGEEFTLAVVLKNNGSGRAYNVMVTFNGGTSYYPQDTGGVSSTQGIDAGGKFTARQTFLGAGELAWTSVGTISAAVTYSDAGGASYTDTFSLTLTTAASSGSTYYATSTPTPGNHAQLVVSSYKTDVDLLQPGTPFELSLVVNNLGNSDALGVTMVLGGGASGSTVGGTPQPGGVSGSSGELTNFAPLNSSNLVYLGDLKRGASATLSQKLIVNTSTQPGVYTLKISFVYTDNKNNSIVDDQVITLLVYSLPQLSVDFYRDPGQFMAQMMNVLPLQVTNLGKKTAVLGNMKVTAEGAEVTNNVSLVGALDPGGYYTLDANIMPDQAGPMDIDVVINYTDDFNQPRTVEQKIHIDVQPPIEMTPPELNGTSGETGMGQIEVGQPETLWQKIGRFIKGLLGLGSNNPETPTPVESTPSNIKPAYPLGGKG